MSKPTAMQKELAKLGKINYAELDISRNDRRDKTKTNDAIKATFYAMSPECESKSLAFGYAPVTGNETYLNNDGSVSVGYFGCHTRGQVWKHL